MSGEIVVAQELRRLLPFRTGPIVGATTLANVRTKWAMVALAVFAAGCRGNTAGSGSQASGVGGVCGGDGLELFAEEFAAQTLPPTETRSFLGLPGQTSGTLCVTAKSVVTGSVKVNGAEKLGALQFNGAAEQTLTADFELAATNSLAVEIVGVSCPPPSGVECASISIRARAIPSGPMPTPPLQAQQVAPLSACCTDVTCDKSAFAAAGGVCAGDPRIRGPLVVDAPAAH